MVKKWVYGLLLIFLVVAAWFLLSRLELDNTADILTELHFNYQAEQEFDPEEAALILGVETSSQDLEQAFAENNEKMEALTARMKEIGQLRLTTLNFQVNPRTRMEDDKQVIEYYVLNQIEVTTEDLEKLGSIIQEAVSAGANKVLSLNYSLKNPEQARESVEAEAIAGMRKKAEFLLEKLNRQEYKLLKLNLSDQYQLRDYAQYRLEAAPQKLTGVALPPITPQKIRITVNLQAAISLL